MSTLKQPVSLTWDLESVFPGGSDSAEFQNYLQQLDKSIKELEQFVKQASAPASVEETKGFDEFLDKLQEAAAKAGQASSFISCLTAQNVKDKKAVQLSDRITSYKAQLQSVSALFENILRSTPDEVFAGWIQGDKASQIAFYLNETREKAKDKLPPELESLVLDLSIDGYHGWGEHYDTIVSKFSLPFTDENGNTVNLSAGQAHNKLHDPDRSVRDEVFAQWEEKWSELADYGADTLNRLAGFRLKLYNKRGWEDVLKEPLAYNRMTRQTLDAMWQAITESKAVFVKYLERKAKLMGVEQLGWADVEAPLGGTAGDQIPYGEAAELIVKEFGGFSPKMAEFAAHAFNSSWIEAEDRSGKRPGGFCTTLSESNETRIFMTFGGTASNVSTLAHELGHAYHSFLLKELPEFSRDYAMNVAETASTFAENILSSAQVARASSKEEKIKLLEEKVQRSVAFFMNIHARFLFETRFYEKRKEGLLSAEDLSGLMEEAQKEAFCDALASYHPHFWLSKLHFYITDVPFYNFPYTFGFLFSNGLFARAQAEGPAFAGKYDALLEDTGRMTVEDLAKKHLNVDLTKPDFWREAVAVSAADVEQFLELTKDL
ncbi:M3 family oligoendopeptidase [Paenibacillus pinistramenti]|uniref:M3 family oligoendopeptidase n=1 Tax=Paenibacillus pinistramenti TaxID=1768003 RepID=UPI0011080B8A|nr:M3 family oligoendopeptidase [Paenibacillus pinistramenti]